MTVDRLAALDLLAQRAADLPRTAVPVARVQEWLAQLAGDLSPDEEARLWHLINDAAPALIAGDGSGAAVAAMSPQVRGELDVP